MKRHILTRILACICLLLGTHMATKAQQPVFRIDTISQAVRNRIVGRSYPKEAESRVPLNTLRYLTLSYVDLQGTTHTGEMIVNKAIANDVVAIFKELYAMKYPVERMELIENFDADDEKSMQANNTSGFCFRIVKGTKHLSAHARGMAVDINPLYNPCFKLNPKGGYIKSSLQPSTAAPYADWSKNTSPYKITQKIVKLFKARGFRWGGDWRTMKDYQHFDKR